MSEPEHIQRIRAFKFYFKRGDAYATTEAMDGMKLLEDYDALRAEVERLRGLLTEWVADAHWNPRANLPDLVNRTKRALADQPDAASTNSPKVSSGLVDAQPDGFCTKCNGPIYLHRCAADSAAAQPDAAACRWKQDAEGSEWDTDCGLSWSFEDGGPTENGGKFCIGCGKPLIAVPYVDPQTCDECGEDLVDGACPECTADNSGPAT